jgi:hypothetical protein
MRGHSPQSTRAIGRQARFLFHDFIVAKRQPGGKDERSE